ncbi:MAG: hypothetical protein LJE65_10960 [Desulfobacteraceae bacterium]|nr:hypothetical protein [Desulfobacteraceae bacterium]
MTERSEKKRNGTGRVRSWVLRLAWILFILAPAIPAQAHRVSVFAWVEGDTVHTESKFGGGRKAKGAVIEVYDETGKMLLTGKTDDNGAFSFAVPKIATLEVVLKAGTGHQGSWTVSEAEIREAKTGMSTGSKPSAPSGEAAVEALTPPSPTGTAGPAPMPVQELRNVVEEAMAEQLRPILGRLARLEDQAREPDLKDILGGIGYIFGLAGVAAYVAARKRNR